MPVSFYCTDHYYYWWDKHLGLGLLVDRLVIVHKLLSRILPQLLLFLIRVCTGGSVHLHCHITALLCCFLHMPVCERVPALSASGSSSRVSSPGHSWGRSTKDSRCLSKGHQSPSSSDRNRSVSSSSRSDRSLFRASRCSRSPSCTSSSYGPPSQAIRWDQACPHGNNLNYVLARICLKVISHKFLLWKLQCFHHWEYRHIQRTRLSS